MPLDQQVHLVKTALQDQVALDQPVQPETMVHQAQPVQRDHWDRRVGPEPRALPVQLELLDHQDRRVQLEAPEIRDQSVLREHQGPPVRQVTTED